MTASTRNSLCKGNYQSPDSSSPTLRWDGRGPYFFNVITVTPTSPDVPLHIRYGFAEEQTIP